MAVPRSLEGYLVHLRMNLPGSAPLHILEPAYSGSDEAVGHERLLDFTGSSVAKKNCPACRPSFLNPPGSIDRLHNMRGESYNAPKTVILWTRGLRIPQAQPLNIPQLRLRVCIGSDLAI